MTAASAKEQGDNLYKQSKFQEAILSYNTILEQPNNQNYTDLHVIYSNRCACYLQVGNIVKAIEDANSCIRLKPDWFKGYSRKGACLLKLNLLQEAALAYEKVIELDPSNIEASNALNKIRANSNNSNSGSYNNNNGNNNDNSNTSTQQETTASSQSILNRLWSSIISFLSNLYNKIVGFNYNSVFQNIQNTFAMLYGKLMAWWYSLNETTTNYIKIGLIGLVLYYFFFYRNSSSYMMDDHDYHPHHQDYNSYPSSYHNNGYNNGYNNYGSNSYYTGGGGMSWTTWGLIMLGAWKLPPLFPEQLGEYARPFFGMNWTTFMWLLNMFSRNTAGMGGYGGGRGGGFFGNRRRW